MYLVKGSEDPPFFYRVIQYGIGGGSGLFVEDAGMRSLSTSTGLKHSWGFQSSAPHLRIHQLYNAARSTQHSARCH